MFSVSDKKLGKVISEKLGISCVSNEKIDELFRIIRFQFSNLVDGSFLFPLPHNVILTLLSVAITPEELNTMTRGLSHGLSRYKIKFSTDKIDTMIIQAVSLIEDLDRELNNYMMRLREWYGWHFPELGKIVTDNLIYAKIVQATGFRVKIHDADLSEIIPEDISKEVKDAAEISMGSDITETDEQLILNLAQQIIIFSEYRATLSEYLKNRMQAVAPNLTIMVGELVGAKLIAHAGSLVSLAKCPASTIQIIGAEKSFFKALKTRHNTPKYGIIYQSALVGQAPAKLKGKISRALAAKTALCIRVDALCEAENAEIGVGCKEYLENRLRLNEKEILLKDEKFARRPPEGGARVKKPGELYGEQYNQEGDFNLGKVQPVAKTFVKGQTLTAT